MLRRKLLAATILVAMLTTLGCGAEPKTDDTAEDPSLKIVEDTSGSEDASVTAGSEQAQTLASRLMTPADVEKVSGLSGLKVVPKDPSVGAGGDVNIATADDQLVVMLNVGDGDFYDLTKSGPNFGRDHSGIGDQSYVGPAKDIMPTEYLLGVKSGSWGVVIASFFDTGNGGEPYLSIQQLEALAEVAISRL